LPTRVTKQILPCLGQQPQIHFSDVDPEVLDILAQEREQMSRRIDCLARDRDAVDAHLQALGSAATSTTASSAAWRCR
jgi:hypothetical protein